MRMLILSLTLLLGGCIPVVLGGVATTGTVVAQERSAGQSVDDTAIFWQIKHLYVNQNAQDLFSGVNIEVIEGRVYLTGKVNNLETRVDAVRLAWQPNGVKEVINEITINDKQQLSEMANSVWLANNVRSRLILEKNIRSLNYSVDASDGVVYLMGIAQSQEELDQAVLVASKVKGVQKVVSHVVIKNSTDRGQ